MLLIDKYNQCAIWPLLIVFFCSIILTGCRPLDDISSLDPREQIEYYTAMIERNSDDAEAYYHRAVATVEKLDVSSYRTGELEAVVADYTKAIEISPLFAEAYTARATIYQGLWQSDLASQDLAKACELDHKYCSK